jgi:hypothetical protein
MQLRHIEPNSSMGAKGLTWMTRLQWQHVNVSASWLERTCSHLKPSKVAIDASGATMVA